MSRADDIRRFLESDKIQPASWRAAPRPFVKPLIEVMQRLPNDVFDCLETQIEFAVDVDDYYAVNVSLEEIVPASPESAHTIKKEVIVLFRSCWGLSHGALTGLIAHEIAHSMVERRDHSENEEAADELVRAWGFAAELELLSRDRTSAGETQAVMTCPRCGSRKIARISYGLPDMNSEELKADVEAGRVVLGGCLVSGNNPTWHCVDCQYEQGPPDKS